MPGDVVQVVGREEGAVVEVPHARDGHVADGIVVRPGLFVGPVDPLVPVAPVAVVESDVEIVQEVGIAPAAGFRQGRFRHDGVPFQEYGRGVEGAHGPGPHLAHQEVHPPERAPVGELHLRHVAGFVGGQLRHPGLGIGAVGLGMGIEVHPFRRPGHGAVGIGIPGVQDDRRPAPLQASGRHAGAPPHARLPFLEVQDIGPRQGVRPLRVHDTEVLRAHLVPPAIRVRPGLVELGLGKGAGDEGGGKKEGPQALHITKLTIFS